MHSGLDSVHSGSHSVHSKWELIDSGPVTMLSDEEWIVSEGQSIYSITWLIESGVERIDFVPEWIRAAGAL